MSFSPERLKQVAESKSFNFFITGLILLTSALLGAETYPSVAARFGHAIEGIDRVILGCFVVEILIRMGAEGRRPWRYFRDPWNLFDFSIVAVCLLPLHSQSVAVFRIVRILRVLRLLKAMPRLRMIVQGMMGSLSSIGYVAVLLFMTFYVFAVLGVTTFGAVDPAHFGRLTTTLLTLFQVITLENWPDVMSAVRQAYPVGGPLYFVLFILIGTMVILNLFTGAIVSGMNEAYQDLKRECQGAPADRVPESPLPAGADRIEQIHRDIAMLTKRVEELQARLK